MRIKPDAVNRLASMTMVATTVLGLAVGCPTHSTTENPEPKTCISGPPGSTPTPYPHAWEVCPS